MSRDGPMHSHGTTKSWESPGPLLANLLWDGYGSLAHRAPSEVCGAGFELLGFGMVPSPPPPHPEFLGRVSLAATICRKKEGHCKGSPGPEPQETQSRLQPSLSAASSGSWNLLVTTRIPVAQRRTGLVGGSRERGVVRKASRGGVLPGSARAQRGTSVFLAGTLEAGERQWARFAQLPILGTEVGTQFPDSQESRPSNPLPLKLLRTSRFEGLQNKAPRVSTSVSGLYTYSIFKIGRNRLMDAKVHRRTIACHRRESQARTHCCLLFKGPFWQNFEVKNAANINFGKSPKQTTTRLLGVCH